MKGLRLASWLLAASVAAALAYPGAAAAVEQVSIENTEPVRVSVENTAAIVVSLDAATVSDLASAIVAAQPTLTGSEVSVDSVAGWDSSALNALIAIGLFSVGLVLAATLARR